MIHDSLSLWTRFKCFSRYIILINGWKFNVNDIYIYIYIYLKSQNSEILVKGVGDPTSTRD